jgi:hypothetical protein
MKRTLLLSVFIYLLFEYFFRVPRIVYSVPLIGIFPSAIIITIIIVTIEFIYRCFIPAKEWKPWDVFAMILITLTVSYGYLNLASRLLIIVSFTSISLLTLIFLRVIYHYMLKNSYIFETHNTKANRHHFAVAIIIFSLIVPTAIIFPKAEKKEVEQEELTPLSTALDRKTLIMEYLLQKYPDVSSSNQWNNDKIIDFLQDIEYIEANVAHRTPVRIIYTDKEMLSKSIFAPTKGVIIFNPEVFEKESVLVWIAILLHEGRHVYQYQLVSQVNWDNPIVQNSIEFSHIYKLNENLKNYVTSYQNEYDAYYNQLVEVDARQFSEEILPIYQNLLQIP